MARRLFASPLACALAALACALAGLALTADPSSTVAGRSFYEVALGLLVVLVGVRVFCLAPQTATGARRLLARLASLLGALLGVLHVFHVTVGSAWGSFVDAMAPGVPLSARAWLGAATVALVAVWTWHTSPAIRG